MRSWRWLIALGGLTSGLTTWAPRGWSDQTPLVGLLNVLWHDRFDRGTVEPRWVVTRDDGTLVEIGFADAALERRAFDLVGQRVTTTGTVGARGRFAVAGQLRSASDRAPFRGPEVEGDRKWLVLLCQFAGDRPFATPGAILERFANQPGRLDHYFREVSGGRYSLAGTAVRGWYTLPRSLADYGGAATFRDLEATADCLERADPEVYLPEYSGVVVQFSNSIGRGGAGGWLTLSLDGRAKRYGFAWISGWTPGFAGYDGVVAHEIGHAMGLLHSHGAPDREYSSDFDVMSNALLVHPIGYHKELLGWQPLSRVITLTASDQGKRIGLAPLAGPPGSLGPTMVRIPLGPRQFFTVESRRRVGYDLNLPRAAVVIHSVSRDRGLPSATLVDSNNDPDDNGAGWNVGQTFTDRPSGTTVRIDSLVGEVAWITASAPSSAPRTHTVTVQITGSGMVRESSQSPAVLCSSVCSHVLIAGEQLRLQADPDSGMYFGGWGGDCRDADCSLTVDRDLVVTASFERGHQVSVDLVGRGAVWSLPVSGIFCTSRLGRVFSCGNAFAPGTALRLVARPDSGAYFAGFEGAGCGPVPSCDLLVAGPAAVKATFRDGPSLHVDIVGQGAVLSDTVGGGWVQCFPGGGDPGACDAGFPPGSRPTLSWQRWAPGYQLVTWTGPCRDNGRCQVSVDEVRRVGAVFADRVLLWTDDSTRRTEVAFRGVAGRSDSVRVTLGGPGATTWVAESSRRFAQLAAEGGMAFDHIRWSRQTGSLNPGWQIDTIVIRSAAPSEDRVNFVDSLLVRAQAVFATTRAGRVDSLVESDPAPAADSVEVRFTGPDAVLVPWQAVTRGPRLTLRNGGGVGAGWVRWDRSAGSLVPGRYLDTLIVEAPAASGPPLVVTDTLYVLSRPNRVEAASALLAGATLGSAERRWLDGLGNRDGLYNLGDFLAFLDRGGLPRGMKGGEL